MKIFTALILIGVAFGLSFIYTKPAYSTIMELRQKISQYDDAALRADQVVAKRDTLTGLRQSFSTKDVARLQTLLPDSVDSIKLVMEINAIALRYTNGIKNVKISNDKKSAPPVSAEVASVASAAYEPVSLSFGISLSYEQFLRFATDLEQNLRITDITSLSFVPSQTSSLYDYSITLSTYVLK